MFIKIKDRTVKCDAEDLEKLSKHRWCLSSYGYVVGGRGLRLHKLVMGKTPPLLEIDHINRDRSDNRKSNLRFVTRIENSRNKSCNNKLGCLGVSRQGKLFGARIMVKGQIYYLGRFKLLKDAIKARKEAEKNYIKI